LFKRHSLDYGDFIKNGIPADELLEATNNDGMAKAAVEVANEQR
jgi:hypothetical protein